MRAPDALQEPILLRQAVKSVVALGPRPHEAAQCIHLVLARVSAVLIHFANADLDRGVVFGFDDAVGRAAFAGDVQVDDFALFVLHGYCRLNSLAMSCA